MENIYLFLFVCLAIRIGFVLIAKFYNSFWFGVFGFVIAFTFLYNFLMENKKDIVHKKIWWNNIRLVHSLNYFTFAILTMTKSQYAYVPLMVDVIFATFVMLFKYK